MSTQVNVRLPKRKDGMVDYSIPMTFTKDGEFLALNVQILPKKCYESWLRFWNKGRRSR